MSVYRDDAGNIDHGDAELRQHPTTPTKPQPLTEFQLLIAASIGRIVPVDGADLFSNLPDTFQPVQRLPVTVYDSNSFVYLAHQRAGEYLRTAGGPNRNADRKQIFIIRADGSVVSRQYLDHTLWTDDIFDREVIYPGATIVSSGATK